MLYKTDRVMVFPRVFIPKYYFPIKISLLTQPFLHEYYAEPLE